MDQEIKTLSSIIVEAMSRKNFTVEKLSLATGVSERFLKAFIESEHEHLPAAPYARAYLNKVAAVLDISENLWNYFLEHNETIRRSGEMDRLPDNRFETFKLNKKIIIIAAVVLVVGYAVLRISVAQGVPEISFVNLTDNMVVSTSSFKVIGAMNPKDSLLVNSEQVYPDKTGGFEKGVELKPGLNILEFKVKRFLGKENVVTKQVLYEAVKATSTPTSTPKISE